MAERTKSQKAKNMISDTSVFYRNLNRYLIPIFRGDSQILVDMEMLSKQTPESQRWNNGEGTFT
jgi:hypothetical protein